MLFISGLICCFCRCMSILYVREMEINWFSWDIQIFVFLFLFWFSSFDTTLVTNRTCQIKSRDERSKKYNLSDKWVRIFGLFPYIRFVSMGINVILKNRFTESTRDCHKKNSVPHFNFFLFMIHILVSGSNGITFTPVLSFNVWSGF